MSLSSLNLKRKPGNALDSVYDYLLGKKDNPELAATLRSTLLSDRFTFTLVDNLDIAMLLSETITDKLENQGITPHLEPLLDRLDPILIKAEPQLKTQLKAAMPSILDYVLGMTDSFTASFNLNAVVDRY